MITTPTLSGIANGLLVACALIVTGTVLRGELTSFQGKRSTPISQDPKVVQNWKVYGQIGHRFGARSPKVTIIEFGDFECPACRDFANRALKGIRANYPKEVAVVFRHWSLRYHRFAYPAARIAECAAAQGRFEAIHDLLYAKQDSLGLKSWASYAAESGVRDLAKFSACALSTTRIASIDADAEAALGLGATGTPTVMINGLLFPSVPDSMRLDALVRRAISGLR